MFRVKCNTIILLFSVCTLLSCSENSSDPSSDVEEGALNGIWEHSFVWLEDNSSRYAIPRPDTVYFTKGIDKRVVLEIEDGYFTAKITPPHEIVYSVNSGPFISEMSTDTLFTGSYETEKLDQHGWNGITFTIEKSDSSSRFFYKLSDNGLELTHRFESSESIQVSSFIWTGSYGKGSGKFTKQGDAP